jgi:hypothetical protein
VRSLFIALALLQMQPASPVGPIYSSPARMKAPFVPSETFDFAAAAAAPSMPTCIGDAHCVALCKVDPASANWQCYDNTGALMTGMTQGVGMPRTRRAFAPGGGRRVVPGDEPHRRHERAARRSRASTTAVDPRHVRRRTTRSSPPATRAPSSTANGGWQAMITDGTNGVQLRRSASQFEFRCMDPKRHRLL